ncbi:MAG: hypothetical protein PHV11_06785 [Candidatus Bipolaricaulis sp.]|nr:hypothetical protein [Candidatus Bipolaricaulis sp.]
MAITQHGLKDIEDALDSLGVALVDHNHQWTDKERKLYEKAKDILFLEKAHLGSV